MPELLFLWTDLLLWLLVMLTLLFIRYAGKRRHLREPWQRVFRSGMAVGAAVVLGVFILIGLLDSIHFRSGDDATNPGEVLSLFDTMVTPLREQQEKSYSAPFATTLYAREMVMQEDGGTERIYPQLKYGGAHLTDLGEKRWDILLTTAIGVAQAIVLWLLVAGLLGLWRRSKPSPSSPRERVRVRGEFAAHWLSVLRRSSDNTNRFPWHVLAWMLLILFMLILVSANLSLKYHILGTDKVGEDVFYQALKSIRTGLVLGTLTTLVMLPAAILMGVMAGYFRGWVDDVIQYLYTTLNSIPGVLLIAASVLMLQVYMDNNAADFSSTIERADMRLLFLCIILGVTSWTGLCRMLRGEALKIRELDYVQASQAFGVSSFRIMMRHLVPNVMHIVLITVVLDFSGLVLAEAVLAYINIGVDPSTNSWGNMINSARLEMAREPIVWWSLSAAFVFMFALVLAANLFSDVVRDAFDPRLRGKG
ncbi:MAG TPA: peptide ABC transporter permease [Gammaproteobacteria bacterium]|nr:peptide ABC transporter permease [Gammaproteobacteria bacterium]